MQLRNVGYLLVCATLVSCESGRAIATDPQLPDDNVGGTPVVGQPGVGGEYPARDTSLYRYSTYSSFGARRRLVVRDAATWDSVWTRFAGPVTPRPATPAVDFGTKMVIVATMGLKSSGGYSIAIDAVSRNGEDVLVVVRETSPGRNCVTTAALTSPAIAVFVPLNTGSVSFREKVETRNC